MDEDKKLKFEDFTEDQIKLLKLAFKLLDDVVKSQLTDDYTYLCKELFELKCKLGIYDLVD